MKLFKLLMLPANTVCNRLGIINQHERGMMRMFVNMMIFTVVIVIVFFVGWKLFA